MRRNRIIWALLWILSLVGISYFGGPISYGFFATVTLVPVVSFAYLLCVYALFRIYQRIDSNNLVANRMVPFFFVLNNEYPFLTFSGIRVRFFTSFSTISGLSDEIEYELLPKTGIERETSLVCKYRGEYEVGIKNVECRDYFQLFRISYRNSEKLRVIVRPRLVYLEDLKNVDINMLLQDSPANAVTPDVLVRDYVLGDDIRQVHWGLTAKSGELKIRNRIGEEQQGIGIVMSTHRMSKSNLTYLPVENKMLEAVLALTLYFVGKGIPVHYYHRGNALENRNVDGMNRFDEFYDFMSGVEFDQDRKDALLFKELSEHSSLYYCKSVFLVLHEWSEEAAHLVLRLNESNVNVVAYLVNEKETENYSVDNMAHLQVIRLDPEDELTEVM